MNGSVLSSTSSDEVVELDDWIVDVVDGSVVEVVVAGLEVEVVLDAMVVVVVVVLVVVVDEGVGSVVVELSVVVVLSSFVVDVVFPSVVVVVGVGFIHETCEIPLLTVMVLSLLTVYSSTPPPYLMQISTVQPSFMSMSRDRSSSLSQVADPQSPEISYGPSLPASTLLPSGYPASSHVVSVPELARTPSGRSAPMSAVVARAAKSASSSLRCKSFPSQCIGIKVVAQ